MNEFKTFREAAEAARSMAIEHQLTIYVFRIVNGSWSISQEAPDMEGLGAASREPHFSPSARTTPDKSHMDWENRPF